MAAKMKYTPLTPALYEYLESHALLAHPLLQRVALDVDGKRDGGMQIPRHQGGFMHLLAKLIGAREAIEVGCYTGYSAIAVASALPDGGKLTAFDIDPGTSELARQYFNEAGLGQVVDLVIGDATKTLATFVQSRGEGFADMAFIDADKWSYDSYYELCLRALRPGGLLIVDNTFRDGEVLAPAPRDFATQTVAGLSEKIKSDLRVEASMLPIADGITLVRKK